MRSYNTAKKALAELVRQELAHVLSRRAPVRYALVDRSLLGTGGALLDPRELEPVAVAKPERSRSRKPKAA